jgi:hypothetical protein
MSKPSLSSRRTMLSGPDAYLFGRLFALLRGFGIGRSTSLSLEIAPDLSHSTQ